MNVLNSVRTALNNNSLTTEVNNQLEIARDLITPKTAAQKLINQMIGLMPRLILEKEVAVSFMGGRGELITVDKDLNDIMWLIALQSTLESGMTSTSGIAALFAQWAKKEMNVTWPKESVLKIANKFVLEMMRQNIITRTQMMREVKTVMTRVYTLTTATQAEVVDMVEELRAAVPMKCKPLTNQPNDWTDNNNGIHESAMIQLINGSKQKTIAPAVLSAVNKLQAVSFVVSQAMKDEAQVILDNNDFTDNKAEEVLYTAIKACKGPVHFPVTMDKRGRLYYRGGMITPQGSDFCKAAFQFANAVALGETGFDAIAIHTANVCGMDKVSINDRISWVQSNIDSGAFAAITDSIDVEEAFPAADTYQATVAILEINRILALDTDPATVTSTLVCHQDGTCNGLQHMAAITGSRQTAESVNCVASTKDDVPSDIYGIIAAHAAEITVGDVQKLIAKYGRSMAKNPVMIVGYGAGEETVIRNTEAFLKKNGEDTLHGSLIGKAYMASLAEHAGAVARFTTVIKSRMKEAVSNGLTSVQWTTADGFVCDIEYTDIEAYRVRAGKFNAVKAGAVAKLDEVKTEGAMAPNVIHSVDAAHLRMVINSVNHDLVTVHDSIGSHAGNFFTTASAIREQFVAVHEFDIMAEVCDNLGVVTPKFTEKRKAGGYNASEALNSTYIFS